MTVDAEAIAPHSTLREQRDASWSGQSIGQIAAAIAERAGLVPAVSGGLAGIVPEGAMQAAESDRQFLGRLIDRLDGRLMVKDGRLLVLAAGERRSASGAALPALAIDLDDGSWVRWRRSDPGVRGSVSVRHYGEDGATIETAVVGSGIPKRRLPSVFAARGPALAAAERKLLEGEASRDWIEIDGGLRPEARALYPLTLAGAPVGFSEQLTVMEVRHTVGQKVAQTVIRARP